MARSPVLGRLIRSARGVRPAEGARKAETAPPPPPAVAARRAVRRFDGIDGRCISVQDAILWVSINRWNELTRVPRFPVGPLELIVA